MGGSRVGMGLDSGMGSPHPLARCSRRRCARVAWRSGDFGGPPPHLPVDRHSTSLKFDGLKTSSAFEPFQPGLMDSTRTVPSRRSVQPFPPLLQYLRISSLSWTDFAGVGLRLRPSDFFFGGAFEPSALRKGSLAASLHLVVGHRPPSRLSLTAWHHRRNCPGATNAGTVSACPSVPARSARKVSRFVGRDRFPRA